MSDRLLQRYENMSTLRHTTPGSVRRVSARLDSTAPIHSPIDFTFVFFFVRICGSRLELSTQLLAVIGGAVEALDVVVLVGLARKLSIACF